jgi:hypothetical protein
MPAHKEILTLDGGFAVKLSRGARMGLKTGFRVIKIPAFTGI